MISGSDSKLNKYLNRINSNKNNVRKKTKRKITVQEINIQLNKIEERKMEVNFQLDELNFAVIKFKNMIEDSEEKINELNKTKAKLIIAKHYLHYRKRMIQEENNNSYNNSQHCLDRKVKPFMTLTEQFSRNFVVTILYISLAFKNYLYFLTKLKQV